jgi:hypothetical protein
MYSLYNEAQRKRPPRANVDRKKLSKLRSKSTRWTRKLVARRRRGYSVDILFKIIFYLVLGVALLGVNLWFIGSMRRTFLGGEVVIAPFQIIGQDDEKGVLGMTLARMLQVQLRKIPQDLQRSQNVLVSDVPSKDQNAPTVRGIAFLPAESLRGVSIPTKLFEPVNINVDVGGVEVGGVFAWLQRWVIREETVTLAVYYKGDRAVVIGNLDAFGASNDPLWLETGSTPDEITSKIAYFLVKKNLSEQGVNEIDALSLDEFRSLLVSIDRVAELNHNVELGRPAKDDFASLFADIEQLANKMPKWDALILLTAEVADSAERYDKALLYYQQFRKLDGGAGPENAWVDNKIAQLAVTVGQPSAGQAASVKLKEDAAYAVDYLNKLFGMSLSVPPLTLEDPSFTNAFWDGKSYHAPPQIQYLPDITYNQIALPFIQAVVKLPFTDQPGAILNSYADIFSELIEQQKLGQTAETGDWLIAPGAIAWMLGEDVPSSANQSALRSLKAPGTAYDDPVVGKDPQPAHMKDYVSTTSDNGGVHINSGIPNKAFYETAIRIGSEEAGQIWYEALNRLKPTSEFNDLAIATYDAAGSVYGEKSQEQRVVQTAWDSVGIPIP